MKKNFIALGIALGLAAVATTSRSDVEQTEAVSIIAKCAEAMGGAAKIKDIRTLRAEVVYPDHDASAILHEIRRPNLIRTERPGEYVAIFDGRRGVMLKYDPAKPGQAPVPQDLPAEAARGFETDLVWFFPSFFDFPAEYAGIVESNGAKCHKLITTLPLGTRAEYLVDARTYLVNTIAVDESFQGQTFHMEREWLDFKPVQGIIYPSRMTYPGRGGKTATAELKKIEFNPVLSDDRFKAPSVPVSPGFGRPVGPAHPGPDQRQDHHGTAASAADERLKYILPAYFSDPKFPIPEEILAGSFHPDIGLKTFADCGNWDFREEEKSVICPVLFLWGEDDPFGLEMADVSKRALGNSDLAAVSLKECGHYWQENMDGFFREVEGFLKKMRWVRDDRNPFRLLWTTHGLGLFSSRIDLAIINNTWEATR